MTLVWKRTSPRTTSWNTTSRSAGTRNRMTAFSPFSTRRRAASTGMSRQRPAYCGGRPAASACWRSASSCSAVQKQRYAQAARQQFHGVRAVDVEPLGLAVGAGVAARLDAFGPVEPHPPQVLEDRRLGRARRPLEVGVLDPQDEGAARAARQQPVEERGAGVADVELPGGAGREPDAHRPSRSRAPRDQRHGVGGHRLPGAHRLDALVGLGLHAHLRHGAPERAGQVARAWRRRAAPASAARQSPSRPR